jgi:hypothetical protein
MYRRRFHIEGLLEWETWGQERITRSKELQKKNSLMERKKNCVFS